MPGFLAFPVQGYDDDPFIEDLDIGPNQFVGFRYAGTGGAQEHQEGLFLLSLSMAINRNKKDLLPMLQVLLVFLSYLAIYIIYLDSDK